MVSLHLKFGSVFVRCPSFLLMYLMVGWMAHGNINDFHQRDRNHNLGRACSSGLRCQSVPNLWEYIVSFDLTLTLPWNTLKQSNHVQPSGLQYSLHEYYLNTILCKHRTYIWNMCFVYNIVLFPWVSYLLLLTLLLLLLLAMMVMMMLMMMMMMMLLWLLLLLLMLLLLLLWLLFLLLSSLLLLLLLACCWLLVWLLVTCFLFVILYVLCCCWWCC